VVTASKAVLITGCSTGIGRATAERMASAGYTVYATARRLESIEDLEAKGCRTLALDVTDEDSMSVAVRAVEDAEGAVGALVNNAGYSQSGAVESVGLDEIRAQFETNVFGLIPDVAARAWRHARAGLGPDRERGVDGRQAHLPGRRDLLRHEVRGGGHQRRDAVRARSSRGRARKRCGAHRNSVSAALLTHQAG